MPSYRGHVVGGCVAYGLLLAALSSSCGSWKIAAEWFACCIAGALFPDIDTKSRGQKYFYWIILALFAVLIARQRYDLLAVLSICALTPMLVNHRGIFHHFWFVILLPLAVWFVASNMWPSLTRPLLFDALFFIAGAVSHLWLDFYFVPTTRALRLSRRKKNSWD